MIEGFDWAVEFAEVFQDSGFDIAVANPPYVRQEIIKELKPALKAVFPEVFVITADLYVYFYARALQILRPGGMLAFISSNKWFRSAYGERLRGYIAENCRITSITDLGELPVFQEAATFPMIFLCQKGNAETRRSTLFTQVTSLDAPYPDIRALIERGANVLPTSAIAGSKWTLADAASIGTFERMKANSSPLGPTVGGRILYGIKTGLNKAFVLDEETRRDLIREDRRSAEIIHPLAVGDDVRKWHVVDRCRWLIVRESRRS